MKKAFALLLVLVFATSLMAVAKNPSRTGVSTYDNEVIESYTSESEQVRNLFPQADVLFIFAAYDSGVGAWGDTYWNPSGAGGEGNWSLDSINPSSESPSGNPYHWNGGLGTAYDNLGITWEWYPTSTSGAGGQTVPDVSTLQDYNVVFVHTFDNFWDEGITSSTRTTLGDYMDDGGHVILISQDGHYAGLPSSWLDDYFECGSIEDDVYWAITPFMFDGTSGTFLDGWSGTAEQGNFSSHNPFFPDDVETNYCLDDGAYEFASYSDTYKSIYSTAEFEACGSSEVEEIADLIYEWIIPSNIQPTSLGNIKSLFAE